MGTVYARGKKLWFGFKDAEGRWVYRSSGLVVGQEGKAQQSLAKLEQSVRDDGLRGYVTDYTFSTYLETWLAARTKRGLMAVRNDAQRLVDYVSPVLGRKKLAAVTTRDLRNLFAELRAKFAPRTVMNTYGALHRLFADAVSDELLDASPCNLDRRDLPGRVDKDRTWRAKAVFARAEAAALLGTPSIPIRARTLYALGLLAGLREGEISALRWGDVEKREPLDCLHVHSSFTRVNKKVKSTKTDRARTVPIHPELAKLLAKWKLEQGGKPGDLVLPNRGGRHVTDSSVLKWLKRDLLALGLRHRRFHDTRRTFISLAIADGARKDVLRWVTHGPDGDIMDLYTTLPWAPLCEAVAALKLKPNKTGEVLKMAAGAYYNPSYTSPSGVGKVRKGQQKSSVGRKGLEHPHLAVSSGQSEGGAGDPESFALANGQEKARRRSISYSRLAEAAEQVQRGEDPSGSLKSVLATLRGGR